MLIPTFTLNVLWSAQVNQRKSKGGKAIHEMLMKFKPEEFVRKYNRRCRNRAIQRRPLRLQS
jgi:hypothetical protein